jgi:hypothetical protein
MKRKSGMLAIALVVLILVTVSAVFAQTVDLTTLGSSGQINDAWFIQGSPPGSAGTGVWDPFLRLNGNTDIVEGYNTDADPHQFPAAQDPKTKSLLLSNVPLVEHNGILYREFSLDINQSNQNSPSCGVSNFDCFLSLDRLKLFATNNASLTGFNGTDFGGNATLLYDMDAGDPTNSVEMNAGLSSGSGGGDIFVLIPADLFDAYANCDYGQAGCTTFITLYSLFGENIIDNDGFEEWAVRNLPYVQVSKTADATETNTYEWDITKEFDEIYNLAPGESVDHEYVITVDQTVTPKRSVTGTITISVPDDADFDPRDNPAMIEKVEDVLSDGSTATVTCPEDFPFELEPGDTLVCTYEADAQTAAADNNIATVTLDNGTYFIGEAPFEYEVITEGYPDIGVNDTNFPNDDPKWTADSDDEWTYEYPFACPTDASLYDENGFYTLEHVNTAEIVETGDSDTATVTLNCQWGPEELDVTKTAATTFTRTWDWTIVKGPDRDYDGVPGEIIPHTYGIAVDSIATDSEWAVSGTITIENNTPFAATITSVTDNVTFAGAADVDCPGEPFPITLDAGEDLVCTYSKTLTNGAERENTATVTTSGFVDGGTHTVPVTFGAPTTQVNPQINVTDDFGTPNNAGDDLSFGPWGDGDSGSYDRDFTCPTDPAAYTNGVYTETVVNTATIDETGDSDDATVTLTCTFPPQALDVTKTATTTYTRTYDWTITKGPDNDFSGTPSDVFSHTYNIAVDSTYVDSGWAVNGTITIENNTSFAATITSVTDVVSDNIAATVNCGVTFPHNLPAGGELECTYSAALPNAMQRTNTATVATSSFVSGDTGNADVIFGAPTTVIDPEINVTDDFGTPNNAGDDLSFGPWSDGDSGSYDRDFTCPTDPAAYTNGIYTETVVNTATIDETGDSDDATVTLTCNYDPQSLTVNKTAVPTFTRTWNWDITKEADADYEGEPGDSWLHTYLINVTKSGFTDSAWAVTGQITIDNNTAFPATITGVSDEITGFGSVEVTCPQQFPYVLAAGGQLVCTYAQPLTDGTDRTNTATVTTTGFVGGGTDDAAINFVTPTTKVNENVNVTDDYGTQGVPGDDIAFGPFGDSGQVGYERTFSCPTDLEMYDEQGLYTATVVNTAKITETGESDDATVTVTCRIPPVVSVCPVDAAVYERTDLLGKGMGSNVKATAVTKVFIPNPTDVLELYGQVAGKDQKAWKYARFIRPNGTYINDKTLDSPAYRDWAVFWYGEYLTPATLPHWRARLIGAPSKAPFVQRAFILYPTYRTDEQYVNVWETFANSAENHVFWEEANGWIPAQQQVIEIPAPQQPVDLVVKVAVVDNDKDDRPFELTVSAGGVSQFVSLSNPTNGDLLNIVEVTLRGVPAGTDEIVIDLVSPAEIGDSVAMVGMTAHYLCEPIEDVR